MNPGLAILLIAAGLAAFWWFWDWPPAGADTVLEIKSGTVQVRRGHLRPPALADVREIVREAGVRRGYIAMSERRVIF